MILKTTDIARGFSLFKEAVLEKILKAEKPKAEKIAKNNQFILKLYQIDNLLNKTENKTMTIVKKIFDYAVWVLIFFFFGLSLLFYFSKDAVPGEPMFGTKLGLEKIMIATSAILNRQVDTQIEFVARRYNEVNKVLASEYGSESLKRLDNQVIETAQTIALIENPVEKKEAAAKYSAQLLYISTGLKQEQEKIITNTQASEVYQSPTVYSPPSQNQLVVNQDSYPTPTLLPPSTIAVQNQPENTYQAPPAFAQVPPPQIASIASDINNTQTTIQQTINQMNQIQQQTSSPPVQIPTSTPIPIPTTSFPGNEMNKGNQYGIIKNNNDKDIKNKYIED